MVRSPDDLKKLSLPELQRYVEDVRQLILSTCLKNGGHLGASLGAVELAVALHYVFDSPEEPLVWDVGHQAYAHKIITGRADRFGSLRQLDGISGFLSRDESEHDVFGAGHSSTSISAALAMAWSRRGSERWSVAVIGDGGLTAGIAFEALNNVRTKPIGPLLVIVNDNQMSIAPNVGAVPNILSGPEARGFLEHFGLRYFGPVDGHHLEQLIGTLRGIRELAKESDGAVEPIVLHVMTQKGKGYAPAEENPGVYHGVSPVPSKITERPSAPKGKSFSEEMGDVLCRIAQENEKVVAITAAMPDGTGLVPFSEQFPDRIFDVGIAEPHAVTFAAGLATQGYRPVVAIYSTFLQRGLDQIIHDVALQRLPVVFAIDRAGLVGADGPTHHGEFDLAYLGMIPELQIHAPETLSDVEACFREALSSKHPVAIRYPRGSGPQTADTPVVDGVRWHVQASEPKVLLVSVGTASARAKKAMSAFSEGISWATLIRVKPISEALHEYRKKHPRMKLFTLEDGVIHGGVGQALGAERVLGYGDHFVAHGAVEKLEQREHVAATDIEQALRELLSSTEITGQ